MQESEQIVQEQEGERVTKEKAVTEGGAPLSSVSQLKIYQFHRFY